MRAIESSSELSFIDLFCGAGGSSLGFIQEKFTLINAVDIDKKSCETFEYNLAFKPINTDIKRMTGEDLTLGALQGEIDLLVACPPCQGFTTIGRRLNHTDPRNNLLKDFIRITKEIVPAYIFFENVQGFTRSKKHFYYLLTNLKKLGYNYTYSVINAADYGIPQRRIRFLLLATRLKSKKNGIKFPSQTHCNPKKTLKTGLRKWSVSFNAIGDLPRLENGEKDLSVPNHVATKNGSGVLEYIKKIPKNGGSRMSVSEELWHPCHKNRKSGFENMMGRISWDSPGPTITSGCLYVQSGRFIHPDQDRCITIREAARFQGFPDDFVFLGSKRSQAIQVGNALAPPLARKIAKYIKNLIIDKEA